MKKRKRYWDFSFAQRFLTEYRNDINLFELKIFYDDEIIPEKFVENGELIKALDASYQMFHTNIDGVLYTSIDIPCIHVIYNSGKEEYIACYLAEGESYGSSHRKLKNV